MNEYDKSNVQMEIMHAGYTSATEISKELTLQCRVLFIIRIAMSCELSVWVRIDWSGLVSVRMRAHTRITIIYVMLMTYVATLCICVHVSNGNLSVYPWNHGWRNGIPLSVACVCLSSIYVNEGCQIWFKYIRLSLENDCSNPNCL